MKFVGVSVERRGAEAKRNPRMLYTIIGLLHLILFLIAAFEILTSGRALGEKVLWLLVIFLLPVVGLILYYVVARNK